MRILLLPLSLALFFRTEMVRSETRESAPAAQVSASPQVTSSPQSISVPALPTPKPLTAAEKKKLPLEFKRALSEEERSLDRAERSAFRELSAFQATSLKSWRASEKKLRQTYFDQHESGPDRRAYIHGYITRKKDYDRTQQNETTQLKKNWKSKREELKASQSAREAQFKTALDAGQRPPADLWPKGH